MKLLLATGLFSIFAFNHSAAAETMGGFECSSQRVHEVFSGTTGDGSACSADVVSDLKVCKNETRQNAEGLINYKELRDVVSAKYSGVADVSKQKFPSLGDILSIFATDDFEMNRHESYSKNMMNVSYPEIASNKNLTEASFGFYVVERGAIPSKIQVPKAFDVLLMSKHSNAESICENLKKIN